MFTTANGAEFVTTKPAVPAGTVATQWFRDPPSGGAGTPLNQDVMNDLLANIRQAATLAGVNLATGTRGRNTALAEIIRGLARQGFELQVTSAYDWNPNNAANFAGPQPLLRSSPHTTEIPARWVSSHDISQAERLIYDDLALDVDGVTRRLHQRVFGVDKGVADVPLYAVNANGSRGARITGATNLNALLNKPIYLTFTSGTPGFTYSPIRSIHIDQRWQRRLIGVVVATNTSGGRNDVTINFNTQLNDAGVRVRPIILSPKGGGSATLDVEGVVFEDFSQLTFAIRNGSGLIESVVATPEEFELYGVAAGITSIGSRERETYGVRIRRSGNNTMTISGGAAGQALYRVNGVY